MFPIENMEKGKYLIRAKSNVSCQMLSYDKPDSLIQLVYRTYDIRKRN